MRVLILSVLCVSLYSCSVQQKIAKNIKKNFINDSALVNAHVGVTIYDPASKKYLYDYQGAKYFVPAAMVAKLMGSPVSSDLTRPLCVIKGFAVSANGAAT